MDEHICQTKEVETEPELMKFLYDKATKYRRTFSSRLIEPSSDHEHEFAVVNIKKNDKPLSYRLVACNPNIASFLRELLRSGGQQGQPLKYKIAIASR